MTEIAIRPGRPRALTIETQTKLIEGIRFGLFLTTACRLAGITPGCFYHWRRKARAFDPEAAGFEEFFHTIEKVSALAEIDAVKSIRSGDRDSWRAAAWFLERRHPERWGHRRA